MLVEIPLLGRFLSSATSRRLDDTVDRLHSVTTVRFLLLCVMFVGAKQHFGQPIQCMLPAHLDLFDMKTIVEEAISIRSEIKMDQRSMKVGKIVDFIRESFDYRHKPQQSPSKLLTTITYSGSSATIHYFPRVTFCDMKCHTLGEVEMGDFQYVLILNVVNEKLFVVIWFWILFLVGASAVNFIYTIAQLLQRWCRDIIIGLYLYSGGTTEGRYFLACGKRNVRAFIDKVLGTDGVLMLRFVRIHAGVIIVRDITINLFRSHVAICGVEHGSYSRRAGRRLIASEPDPSLQSVDDNHPTHANSRERTM